jgi:hypothetical protein
MLGNEVLVHRELTMRVICLKCDGLMRRWRGARSRKEVAVRNHRGALATIAAALMFALAPVAAGAYGNGGGGHGGGGHGGGYGGHAGQGWSGHGGTSGWAGRGYGWGGHGYGWGGHGYGWGYHGYGWGYRGWGGWGGWGWGWGWPYWGPWWGSWGWGYPYYGYSSPIYGDSYDPGPTYSAPPPAPSYWYYCPASKTYYPYVSQCAEAWVPVTPNPGQ